MTRNFLAATGLRIGGLLQAAIDGTTVQITPVATVANLPTIGDGSPSVLVDQSALQERFRWQARRQKRSPSGGCGPPARRTCAGLPVGTAITSVAPIAKALLADPFSLASQQALLAVAIAALLLAVIGLLASVATAAERTRDVALLDALGMPPGQVARLLGLEQALTAVSPAASACSSAPR